MLPRTPHRTALSFVALLLGGCSTTTPLTIKGATLGTLEGQAVTTSYTGTVAAAGCSGQFTGALGAPTAPLAIACGPLRGEGIVELESGRVVGGALRMSDGSTAAILPRELVPTRPMPVADWPIFGPPRQAYRAARDAGTRVKGWLPEM